MDEEEKEENMVEQLRRQSQGGRILHDLRRRGEGQSGCDGREGGKC